MPTATIDGIATRYEVAGSWPPLMMYAPGGFNAVIETWSTQSETEDLTNARVLEFFERIKA